ncbi:MAG TPA: hypothetical protein VMB85_10170 [Bryobacteraceae bacterium]|nr:hypothetical protein [Bryobacteraceae bacterium]
MRKELDALDSAGASALISPFAIAEAYGALGDADRAMKYLDKSADLRETMVLYLEIDSAFDAIRKDSRFVALERRVGLRE